MAESFIKITDRDEWQEFLEKVLFKTFFHNIEWEEFLEKQFKWLKFERYLYKNLALLSLARVGNKLISHPFCEYGGPLLLAKEIDFGQFKQDLFSQFKGPIRINFHPRLNLTGTFPVKSERVTYFIEGAPNLRKTTRHEIEKSKKYNIEIKKCEGEKGLKEFYRLHVKNAKKHKIPAYPISFFRHFSQSTDAEVILAEFQNKIIAGSVFLFYDNFAHYFQNALDERYRHLGANYLIIWHQLQSYSNKIFDFGGTRRNSSLEIFKRGWGGKEYPIVELTNYSKGDFRHSRLRDIFGLLPPFFIAKVSPYLLKYKL